MCRPMCGTAIDGGHFARGANRSLPRRLGAPALGFPHVARGPAISRASVSTSSHNAGLEQTGRLSPGEARFLRASAALGSFADFELGVLDLFTRSVAFRRGPPDAARIWRRLALPRFSAMVARRSIRSLLSSCLVSASAMSASILIPAPVRSSSISLTASGSRRTYSCTSSFALEARASSRTSSTSRPMPARSSLTLSIVLASFRHTYPPAVVQNPPGLPKDCPEGFPPDARQVFRVQGFVGESGRPGYGAGAHRLLNRPETGLRSWTFCPFRAIPQAPITGSREKPRLEPPSADRQPDPRAVRDRDHRHLERQLPRPSMRWRSRLSRHRRVCARHRELELRICVATALDARSGPLLAVVWPLGPKSLPTFLGLPARWSWVPQNGRQEYVLPQEPWQDQSCGHSLANSTRDQLMRAIAIEVGRF